MRGLHSLQRDFFEAFSWQISVGLFVRDIKQPCQMFLDQGFSNIQNR